MKHLIFGSLIILLMGCSDTKEVYRADKKISVRVDTTWVLLSRDGQRCSVRDSVVVGDSVSCIWGGR